MRRNPRFYYPCSAPPARQFRTRRDPTNPGSCLSGVTAVPTALLRYLLDLGFFEHDVLAGDGVEFFELELAGLSPRVLFRDVVEAGVGAADQLYQHGTGFGHEIGSRGFRDDADRKIAGCRLLSRQARVVPSPPQGE